MGRQNKTGERGTWGDHSAIRIQTPIQKRKPLAPRVIASPWLAPERCATISLKTARLLRFPRNDNSLYRDLGGMWSFGFLALQNYN